MHKSYRNLVLATCFTLLVGCQTTPREDFFGFHQTTDTTITTAVLEAMLNDENLSTVKVHVETTNGVVLLTGYVKTIRQSDTAEELAKKTEGVKSVRNDIVVRK
jgi:hyperosmotically inducible protein